MSIASWLQGWRDRRRARAIARHRKGIKNKFGQGESRYRAIKFFQGIGGKEGYSGLLERFMVNVDPSIRDEEEKQEVYGIMLGYGADVVPAIEEYLNRKDAASIPITWPLKVLCAVTAPEQAVSVMLRSLEALGTEYAREPERKVLLVSQLADFADPRVVPALIPFLRDHRDEVQLEALAALVRKADEVAREPMLDLLIDPETPVRLKAAIADAVQKLGWQVKGYRKKVEELLPEGLHVDRGGLIKGRWVHSPSEEAHEEG